MRTGFFHGSPNELDVGEVLEGDRFKRQHRGATDPIEKLLEAARPSSAVPHDEAVFMVDELVQLEPAGGGAMGGYVYEVEPIGHVSGPFDGGWWDSIAFESTDLRHRKRDLAKNATLLRMAMAYWDGKACDSDCNGAWREYLASSARVVRVIKAPRLR